MDELSKRLGYKFADTSLLETALTHSSYANERAGVHSNERLEFLGDSVLGFCAAKKIYQMYPDMAEGQMTRMRAELVCEASLHKTAQELSLSKYIRLGKNEEYNGGRERVSILADCVEAIIAALYLDGGMEVARTFIYRMILENAAIDTKKQISDYKTALQELVQRKSDQHLEYCILSESGPDHCKVFEAEVRLNGEAIGTGTGKTKKEAEQSAARSASAGRNWPNAA